MKIRIYRDPERSSIIFICTYLILNEVNSLVQNLFTLSDQSLTNIRIFIMIVLAILVVYLIVCMPKTRVYSFIFAEILVTCLYLYSYFLGVSFSILSEWMITTLPVCVPIMFAAMQIKDFNYFYNVLVKLSWILLLLSIIDMMGGMQAKAYDMHFSYVLLLVILIHISRFFDGKRIYFIFVVFEMLALIAYGSRGALVCIAVYIVFRIAFSDIKIFQKFIYSFAIIILIGLVYILLNNYGSLLLQYLSEMGFNNRTLRLILNGEFTTHDSGRFEIWSDTLSLIQEKPILGWGIRGAINEMGAPYPHNLFLDLWLSFGVLIGSALIVILIWNIVKCVFLYQPGGGKDICLLFLAHAFVFLMFSGTVFTNYYFFILLGFMFNKYIDRADDNRKHEKRHIISVTRNGLK